MKLRWGALCGACRQGETPEALGSGNTHLSEVRIWGLGLGFCWHMSFNVTEKRYWQTKWKRGRHRVRRVRARPRVAPWQGALLAGLRSLPTAAGEGIDRTWAPALAWHCGAGARCLEAVDCRSGAGDTSGMAQHRAPHPVRVRGTCSTQRPARFQRGPGRPRSGPVQVPGFGTHGRPGAWAGRRGGLGPGAAGSASLLPSPCAPPAPLPGRAELLGAVAVFS